MILKLTRRAVQLQENEETTYFLSSQRRGKWRRMARGAVSAARMMISEIPRFKVLVASLAPFFNWRKWEAC